MSLMKFSELNLRSFGHTIQLVGAIYQGEGQTSLLFFPGDLNDGSNSDSVLRTVDISQSEWEALIQQTDHLETEVTAREADGSIKKAILRKSNRQISQYTSWDVFRRDNYSCRYCGDNHCPLTVDHLVVWEHGGPSIHDNLVSSCRRCNKTRGNTPYDQWLQHPYYKKVSQKLSPEVRSQNEALLGTLDKIPKLDYIKSR